VRNYSYLGVLGLCALIAGCGGQRPNDGWCENASGGCKSGLRCDDGVGPTRGQCVSAATVSGGATGGTQSGGASGGGGSIVAATGGAGGTQERDSGMIDGSPEASAEPVDSMVAEAGVQKPEVACSAACTLGETTCDAGAERTCVTLPSGCLGWGPSTACPLPQTCAPGKKQCACPAGSCSKAGSSQCTQGNVQTCEQDGACLKWSAPVACPSPQVCDAAKTGCECPSDSCTSAGAQRCGASGVQTCTKMGSCSAWVTTKTCTAPTTCQASGSTVDCVCGAPNFSCPTRCQAPAGACVAIWFATPDGNGPPADCVHRSEGICRENECDLSIQKKRYIQPPDNIDALVSNCQTGGHFDELFAAVCAEIRARPSIPQNSVVDFFVDIYDAAGAWKGNRWLTNKRCP
jgi:hypothetical protein